MPLTDYIDSTETVLGETVTQLETNENVTVKLCTATSMAGVINSLETTSLPCMVVVLTGQRGPDGEVSFAWLVTVFVVTLAADGEAAGVSARALCDAAATSLHDHSYEKATWKFKRSIAMDFKPEWAVYMADFEVIA